MTDATPDDMAREMHVIPWQPPAAWGAPKPKPRRHAIRGSIGLLAFWLLATVAVGGAIVWMNAPVRGNAATSYHSGFLPELTGLPNIATPCRNWTDQTFDWTMDSAAYWHEQQKLSRCYERT